MGAVAAKPTIIHLQSMHFIYYRARGVERLKQPSVLHRGGVCAFALSFEECCCQARCRASGLRLVDSSRGKGRLNIYSHNRIIDCISMPLRTCDR